MAIFDASVFVRALVDRETSAARWIDRVFDDVELSVPSLVFVEVGNAFAGYVRKAGLSTEGAQDRLEFVVQLPHRVSEVGELASAAFAVSIARGLSVYDACYAVLAEGEDGVLVTADRRLAGAVKRAELV